MKPPQTLARQLSVAALFVMAVLAAGFVIVSAHRSHSDPKPAPPLPSAAAAATVSAAGRKDVQLRSEPVRLASLEDRVQVTGLISYPAYQTVKVAPRVSGGRVIQVFVDVGDHVAAGAPIAVLQSSDASTAVATELQDQANLHLTEAALEHVKRQFALGTPEVTAAWATYDQAMANVAFNKDALAKIEEQARIGGFTQAPLETAESGVITAQSNLTQSQVDLDTSQRAYNRMVKLVQIGVNSEQDLEGASDALGHAKANADANAKLLAAAQEALKREQTAFKTNLYADQAVRAQVNNYQQARLQMDAADRALQIAKAAQLSDLQTAQANVQNAVAAEQSSRAALALLGSPRDDGSVTITSPMSGEIVERDVNPGQVVDTSQETPWQMFVISDTSHVWVTGAVYDDDAAALARNQPVRIHVDAFPNKTFEGVIDYISPALDPAKHAIMVRADLPNPGGRLKDGMYADMTVLAGQSREAPVVPIGAIQQDADSDFVYVQQGETYLRRNVTIGDEKNGECEITSGLKPGELVVTQGAIFLSGQASDD